MLILKRQADNKYMKDDGSVTWETIVGNATPFDNVSDFYVWYQAHVVSITSKCELMDY